MAGKIVIKCFDSIKDIVPADWYFPGGERELFHSLDFLEVLEDSKVEGSKMIYLLAEREGEVIATAVLSIFKISLDLFIGENAVVKWINKNFPDFFKVKILFCGTPVSIGHKNLALANDQDARFFFSALDEKMKSIAETYQVKHLISKELDDLRRKTWGAQFLQLNWFEGFSIPDVKMKITWNNYKQYLDALRSPFRRQIKASLLKLNDGQAIVDYEQLIINKIQVLKADEVNTKEFFEKYLDVMNRATVKLETLNLAFFENIFKKYSHHIRLFSYTGESKERSYFFTIHKDNTLYFLWTARHENKDSRDVYFNLYQAMISYAIRHKVKLIHLGQTAYYAKMRIGGTPKPRFIYYKCLNPIQHIILRSLRLQIFPELKLKPLNVFQSAYKRLVPKSLKSYN